MLLFIFNHKLKSQTNNIAIDIVFTYDQHFRAQYQSEQDAIFAIELALGEIQGFYDNFDIFFNPIGIFRFNIDPSDNYSLRSQISNYFSTTCASIDMIHHFTGTDDFGSGTSSGLNLCGIGAQMSNLASFSHFEKNYSSGKYLITFEDDKLYNGSISNLQGKLLNSFNMVSGNYSLDLSNEINGIYLVRIVCLDDKNRSSIQKIIKI